MAIVPLRNETSMIAKLTTSHDWMRVAVTDAAKNKISLTMSRYKESCSGTGISRETLKAAIYAFNKLRMKKTGQTMGERMQAILELAQKATTIDEYVKSLEQLAAA